MTTEAALLEACRLARDDDAPRLVWADHVGGERGELVVVQCELARGGRPPAEMAVLRRRERALLAAHSEAWSRMGDYARGWEFQRGFVEAALIDATTFVENDAAIAEAAPLLTTLTVSGLTGRFDDDDGVVRGPDAMRLLRRLIESPVFWQLDGLHVVHAGVDESSGDGFGHQFTGLGDDVAQLLAESGALAQLRALAFTDCDVSARGIHALVASRDVGRLERFWLRESVGIGIDASLALLRAAPRLRSLAFGADLLVELAPALGPLVGIELGILVGEAFGALARSPAAPTIEELRLVGNVAPVAALASFPRLRSLDLGAASLGIAPRVDAPAEIDALAALALPGLRRLRCSARLGQARLRQLAEAFGAQLERFEISGVYVDDADELRPLVAGEVEPGPAHDPPLL